MQTRAPSQAPRGVRPLSSVLKTLSVLDAVGCSGQSLRLAEIAAAVKASRATTYQKLVTLVAAGWVEQTAEGAYRLSVHAARMGDAALRQANLGERASIVMEELVLEVRETASLAVMNGMHAELVKRVEAEVVVRVQRSIGTLLSLDQSASGRVLTAFVSDEQREILARKGAQLASESVLREVRRKGYALSTGRDVPGVRSVAVPVFDANGACVSALSIVAPLPRFKGAEYVKPLLRCADRLRGLVAASL
jgi:DNA-binding IclR family transcriptional regulator